MMNAISKLLVANRGEIACRIFRACRSMGIATVAVHSEADRDSLHVSLADEAMEIGPAPAPESYLNSDAVLAAARESGADAVHPGYGFLAENADFARAIRQSGMIWIGPAPETIDAMGDKECARAIARQCGVPILPGSARFVSADEVRLECAALEVNFPILVKAAAGGGGIGMRVVDSLEELRAKVETTQKLAERTFGDPSVYLERYVANARHVEVQIFGFGDGTGIHLFDRDCTIQRRFQKIIEEAPAPALPPAVRELLHSAALKLVSAQHYLGAGTVEFIYDCDREEVYFLEMNTRIQVEHAVTEMITGTDLVDWQIKAAAGTFEQLPSQEAVTGSGHAVECRIYSERPEKNFFPSPGTLEKLRFPEEGEGLRIDTGVREGDSITPFYDPMIAKVIAAGVDRAAAIDRMCQALKAVEISGVGTNIAFLLEVLRDPEFAQVEMTTRYVDRRQQAARRDQGVSESPEANKAGTMARAT
ncbi:MAG: acetyl-CoA carboxylase biotin carboxylase subunit [Hyphomicrobiaceae bacterium]|nr:acetyl-CoA carboxylase biotin carboxylase subunit [Hyphomicrobiaceae bacterium]